MTDQTWKSAERRVARKLGGKRIPNTGTGQEDVAAGRLSVQVKHGMIPKLVTSAMEQARRDCPQGCIPVAAFHPKRSKHTYVTLAAHELGELSPDLLLCIEIGDLARIVNDAGGNGDQEYEYDTEGEAGDLR